MASSAQAFIYWLAKKGAAMVKPDVNYTPTGGDASTLPASVKLKRR